MHNSISSIQEKVLKPRLTVLVEELPFVRAIWTHFYGQQGQPLEVFENPMDFFRQIDRFTNREEQVYFYFDQDFGRIRGVGLELARAIQGRNQKQTVSLITNYDSLIFLDDLAKGRINAVYDKYPPLIFGSGYPGKSTLKDHDINAVLASYCYDFCALEVELGEGATEEPFTLERYFPTLAPKPTSMPIPVPMPVPVPAATTHPQAEVPIRAVSPALGFWQRIVPAWLWPQPSAYGKPAAGGTLPALGYTPDRRCTCRQDNPNLVIANRTS